VILAGGFHGKLDLGTGSLVASGTDVFLLKLAP
jgi:hypothetical protein